MKRFKIGDLVRFVVPSAESETMAIGLTMEIIGLDPICWNKLTGVTATRDYMVEVEGYLPGGVMDWQLMPLNPPGEDTHEETKEELEA